jgi:cell division inhibitor SulA
MLAFCTNTDYCIYIHCIKEQFNKSAEQQMMNIQNNQYQSSTTVNPLLGRQSFGPFVSNTHTTDAAHLLQLIGVLSAQTETQQGWLLVIAPPHPLTKSMLGQLNINSNRILVIQQRQIGHFDNLMRDALTCSTCCAVVSFLPPSHPQLEDYQYLSAKYGTALVNVTGENSRALAH